MDQTARISRCTVCIRRRTVDQTVPDEYKRRQPPPPPRQYQQQPSYGQPNLYDSNRNDISYNNQLNLRYLQNQKRGNRPKTRQN